MRENVLGVAIVVLVIILVLTLIVNYTAHRVHRHNWNEWVATLPNTNKWTSFQVDNIYDIIEVHIEEVKCNGENVGNTKDKLIKNIMSTLIEVMDYNTAKNAVSHTKNSSKKNDLNVKIISNIINQSISEICTSTVSNWSKTQYDEYVNILNSNPVAYCHMNKSVMESTNKCMADSHASLFSYSFLKGINGMESVEYENILKNIDGKCILANPCPVPITKPTVPPTV